MKIPIRISARHIHLSKEHVEELFGEGYALHPHHKLTQPGQFAEKEVVVISGPKGSLKNVRVVGPEREISQVEISRTDEITLGVEAQIRVSGDLENTSGITVIGSKGSVELKKGLIQAKRHLHTNKKDANELGVSAGDTIMVRIDGERGVIFDDVVVRVDDEFALEMHIDTDEANAADLTDGEMGEIIVKEAFVHPDGKD